MPETISENEKDKVLVDTPVKWLWRELPETPVTEPVSTPIIHSPIKGQQTSLLGVLVAQVVTS